MEAPGGRPGLACAGPLWLAELSSRRATCSGNRLKEKNLCQAMPHDRVLEPPPVGKNFVRRRGVQ